MKKHTNMKIMVRWVPGHMGIKGNKAADGRAKEAARGEITICRPIPATLQKKLPQSVSKLHQGHSAVLKAEATTRWRNSPRCAQMNEIDPSLPSKKYSALIAGLLRRHAPLQKLLHKIGKVETPTCPACHEAPETVAHYIIHCPAFNHPRLALAFELGDNAKSLTVLFTNAKSLQPLFQYIHRTKRFSEQLGIMVLPPLEEIREKNEEQRKGKKPGV
ncbi:hypothetical protein PHLCEN_2v1706 [Hermanssonia centrifuga]|uniref:RNase H type-1 domain-containing protein n=1 Tax=Hermanssonia centrifuga TaxID=98765 RepID=A0A2R6RW73_9APHY|nr:hypothetical protein PHLCEN_2v1706 [Hermanssonia centrifuga]